MAVIENAGNMAASWTANSSGDITDTSASTVKAATTGACHYIMAITVSNMHATVGTRVDIKAGSTVLWQGPAAANGGGFSIAFKLPIQVTVSTAITAVCGTNGAAVRVSIQGYTH